MWWVRVGEKKILFQIFPDSPHSSLIFSFHSGQPHFISPNHGCKYIVYSAFVSNGACLPPVIFTSDDVPPSGGDGMYQGRDPANRAHVVHVDGVRQASTVTTEVWLQTMCRCHANYLPADSTLVLDVASWHVSKEMTEIFNQRCINTVLLPAATGKWLNPNDQAIHREMRRKYAELTAKHPREKLLNVIDAYYSVKDSAVLGSWQRTGLLEEDFEARLLHAATEGYRAAADQSDFYESCNRSWENWKISNFRHPEDALPGSVPLPLPGGALDGKHHTRYGRE